MKFYLLLVLTTILHLHVIAQNTTVHIKLRGLKTKEATATVPVNGNYLWFHSQKYPLSADSTIAIPLQITGPALLRCAGYFIIAEPGTMTVELDFTKGNGEPLKSASKNYLGQLLYNNTERPSQYTATAAYLKRDSTADGVKALILADMNKAQQPYDELLSKGEISADFHTFIKKDNELYYASVLAGIPLKISAENRGNKEPILHPDFAELWQSVYQRYPLSDVDAARLRYFYDYAEGYSMFFRQLYDTGALRSKETTFDFTKSKNAHLEYRYLGIENDFTGPVKEYMLAHFLGSSMFQRKYEPELLDLYAKFIKAYPASDYIAPLSPLVSEIKQFQANAASPLSADQVLVENYSSINTVSELLSMYKDKTVYVDLWATWCGPCKTEFNFKHGLNDVLKKNNIEMLYISIDDSSATDKWVDMIKYYDLSGKHILANSLLRQDMRKRFWAGHATAIPRYIIIQNGAIIDSNALRPSDTTQLYAKLENLKGQ